MSGKRRLRLPPQFPAEGHTQSRRQVCSNHRRQPAAAPVHVVVAKRRPRCIRPALPVMLLGQPVSVSSPRVREVKAVLFAKAGIVTKGTSHSPQKACSSRLSEWSRPAETTYGFGFEEINSALKPKNCTVELPSSVARWVQSNLQPAHKWR